jgi:hypothetical protein
LAPCQWRSPDLMCTTSPHIDLMLLALVGHHAGT